MNKVILSAQLFFSLLLALICAYKLMFSALNEAERNMYFGGLTTVLGYLAKSPQE